MKLVLLGTGGYYANDRRHTACLMLPEAGIVLDAGSGMFRLRDYLATNRLDIFLSHAHLDHVVGLTYLLDLLPPDVLAATALHGNAEKLAAIREHLFNTVIFPVPPSFRFQPLDAPCSLSNGGTLTTFPLAHPGGSLGFRLDWPQTSLAYVTDTTACTHAPYIENIRGAKLLVHEAYFAGDAGDMPEITGHSRLLDVARLAAAAQVKELILVHINPRLACDDDFDLTDARRIFPNTRLGTDRMEVEF